MDLLFQLIGPDKIGGWARAIVAAGLTAAVAKMPGLSDILDPATQTAIGIAVSAVVVGAWSHWAKSFNSPTNVSSGQQAGGR